MKTIGREWEFGFALRQDEKKNNKNRGAVVNRALKKRGLSAKRDSPALQQIYEKKTKEEETEGRAKKAEQETAQPTATRFNKKIF